MHRKRCLLGGWAIPILAIWGGRVPAAEAPRSVPVVAELFTSQGCSSCPPAEALLGELSGRSDILPLAFHVTYWDDLGWRDRFSLRGADARQYRYASAMGRRGVYTPQLVINGVREVVGSNRVAALQAIGSAPPVAGIRLVVAGGAARIELPDIAGGCDCELFLLGVLPSAQTVVGRGENAGRVLREFNVVRQISPLAAWNGKAESRAHSLSQMPAGVSTIVLLAQRRGDGRMVAVGVERAPPGG
jgi:hypothetical protein